MKHIKNIIILFIVFLSGLYIGQSEARVDVTKKFHALCNVGVGRPYSSLIMHFNELYKQGKYEELGQKLDYVNTQNLIIYNVWLYEKLYVYSEFVAEVKKGNLVTQKDDNNIQ